MTTLDKPSLRMMRDAINAALVQVGQNLGVKIEAGTVRFTPKFATFKLSVATIGENGEAETAEAAAYREYHSLFGLPADGLGKEFNFRNRKFKIIGLAMKCRQLPLLATCEGKTYKLPVQSFRPLQTA